MVFDLLALDVKEGHGLQTPTQSPSLWPPTQIPSVTPPTQSPLSTLGTLGAVLVVSSLILFTWSKLSRLSKLN